jgi:small-conductance mechanosensitive channel
VAGLPRAPHSSCQPSHAATLAASGTSSPGPASAPSPGGGYLAELLRLLGVSPGTAQHVQDLLLPVLTVVIILVLASLAASLGGRALRRTLSAAFRARAAVRGDDRPAPRIDTVGRIVANLWRVVVWVTAVLVVLGKLGINLSPFLFGATVVGMTIGFGAQTVVRDFLAGFLLLLEDQYRIGDTVTAVGTTGVVDEVSLRVTRLRGADGSTWYVPNGDIRELANLSRQWRRTSVKVLVPVGSDLAAVSTAIDEELSGVWGDPALAERCLEPPRLVGLTDLGESSATIEVSVKTAPDDADDLGRELRRRIVERLTTDGVLTRSAAPRA